MTVALVVDLVDLATDLALEDDVAHPLAGEEWRAVGHREDPGGEHLPRVLDVAVDAHRPLDGLR